MSIYIILLKNNVRVIFYYYCLTFSICIKDSILNTKIQNVCFVQVFRSKVFGVSNTFLCVVDSNVNNTSQNEIQTNWLFFRPYFYIFHVVNHSRDVQTHIEQHIWNNKITLGVFPMRQSREVDVNFLHHATSTANIAFN